MRCGATSEQNGRKSQHPFTWLLGNSFCALGYISEVIYLELEVSKGSEAPFNVGDQETLSGSIENKMPRIIIIMR
jgi:hypothetical protein